MWLEEHNSRLLKLEENSLYSNAFSSIKNTLFSTSFKTNFISITKYVVSLDKILKAKFWYLPKH